MVKDAAEQKELIKKGEEILLVELVGIREEGNAALRAQIQRHHKDVESESTQHGGRMKKETEEQKKQRLQLAKEEAAERERILKEVHAKLEAATKGLNLATVELAGYWQQVDREARKAKQTIELSAEEQKKLADRTQGTADAQKRVRTAAQRRGEVFESNVDSAASLGISFISAANGMGKISDEAATALTSVINMGAAIAKFGIGSPEGIISIVGGLAQLIGGWGSSAAEQARKEAHMKNTRAIEELTRDLSDYNGAASGATFSGVVTALNASKYLKEDGSTGIHSRMVEFNLRAAGLTIGDAKKLADKYGIDVEKDPDGWVRLLEVLEARRFGSGEGNFADELASLTDSWGVLGVEDADDKIQALRTFAAKNIPILADALQGDFSSESGRASIIAKLRALYGDSINAKIPIADYKNATPQQFRAIIAQLLPLLGDANGLLGSGLAVGVGVGTGPVGGTPGTGGTVGLIGGPAVGLSPNLSPGLQLPGGDLPSPTGIPDTFSGVGGLTTINGGLNNAITFNITQLREKMGRRFPERILERFDRVLLMRYDAVRASEGRLPSQAA
ncbi:MAG: hypothetical protein IPN47_19720 [Gemmatimonadetes bacterium]|nr:hypothetical protein [Gemmatimonadota bacterium]